VSYKVDFSYEAASDMDSLYRADKRLFRRVLGKVEFLAGNPWEGKPLVGNHRGEFSLRVGSYRIIYEIDSPHETLHVLTVKHRKHVY
jgi:mRNA interferase RelE/StbE